MFTKTFRELFPEELYEDCKDAYEIAESCYQALDEAGIYGIITGQPKAKFSDVYTDVKYVNTARKYTSSLFLERCYRLEDALMSARDRSEAFFNGYLLNYEYLLKKYKARISDNAHELNSAAILWDTFEYPQEGVYPRDFNKDYDYRAVATEFAANFMNEKDTAKLRKSSLKSAEATIEEFTERMLGESVKSEDFSTVIPQIIEEKLKGDNKLVKITGNNLGLITNSLTHNLQIRATLRKLKTDIPKFFKMLRKLYEDILNNMHSVKGIKVANEFNDLATMQDPNKAIILGRTNSTIAFADMNYNELFLAFANVYFYTIYTKLQIIDVKVDGKRQLVTEILTRLNLIAGLPLPPSTDPKRVFIRR